MKCQGIFPPKNIKYIMSAEIFTQYAKQCNQIREIIAREIMCNVGKGALLQQRPRSD